MRLTSNLVVCSLALVLAFNEQVSPANLLNPAYPWYLYDLFNVDHALGKRCTQICTKRVRGGPCIRYDRTCVYIGEDY